MIGLAMIWNLLILLAVMLVAGGVLVMLAAYLMARALLQPLRMTDGRAAWRLKRLSPGDLQLEFHDLTYTVRDESTGKPLKIAAWWIPHELANGRTLILLHGYADAKVGGIAWAPTLHELGYNILALDLRAHGESEGRFTTAGFFERQDVNQVIDELKGDLPEQTRELVLFGISLGAAVAAAVAVARDDLQAVIMESPYPNYRLAAAAHTMVLGGPGGWLQRWSFRWAQRIAHADFSKVQPEDLIPQIPCPLMVIRSAADVFIDDDHAAIVAAAVARRPANSLSVYWNAENAHHVAALEQNPVLYREQLGRFLERAAERGSYAKISATEQAKSGKVC
jgi:pimeloyl-ACP methyl ester carboxylesterase